MGSGLRGGAQAGTTLTGTFPTGITLPATDFVFIDNATVTGNVTNSSILGIAPIALEVSGGSISGGVTNTSDATISASEVGIYIHDGADIGNGITNDGDIIVSNTGSGLQTVPVAGVWVLTAGDTSLVNNGNIQVTASRTGSGFLPPIAWAGGVGFVDGTGDVDITNSGSIGVLAKASGAPAAFAGALGVVEIASSTGTSVDIGLWNTANADISVKAQATASAIAGAGVLGIFQGAFGANNVAIDLTNDGSIEIAAAAKATGSTAIAGALVGFGLMQIASAGGTVDDSAIASLTNTSNLSLDILANATATGTAANATARMAFAIDQHAVNAGDVDVRLENSGAIKIAAEANANGSTAAIAVASVGVSATITGFSISWTSATVVHQFAGALGNSGSTATVALDNSSTFDVSAIASASATGNATARAVIYNAVSQAAVNADTATVELYNSGTIDIVADANAGGDTTAVANASLYEAVTQEATAVAGGTEATATLTNDGTINIEVLANATASTGNAAAYAYNFSAIEQDADDAGATNANIANNGSLNLKAQAQASGGTFANADAVIQTAIAQTALGNGADGDVAAVTLTNSADATLNISALATAMADRASASARVTFDAISQTAFNADYASAALDNTGTINILAGADAVGAGFADAYASNYSAVDQEVVAANNELEAAASISNDGTLNIGAHAGALAQTGSAAASAYITNAIIQNVHVGSLTLAGVANNGTLIIHADAEAVVTGSTGFAFAYASVSSGIFQDADAEEIGSATASISNTSTLEILAEADAVAGDTATASAGVDWAIHQWAHDAAADHQALASVDNSGDLVVGANAEAEAFDASAAAYVDAVNQFARANTDGQAEANFNNSGDFSALAVAIALGRHNGQSTATATASAFATARGVYQSLSSSPGYEPAMTAAFDNSGSFSVAARATASATAGSVANDSRAGAYANGYVAYADTAGDTIAVAFANSGDFVVHAKAVVARSQGTAVATAFGVHIDAPILTGSFENSGNLTVVALALHKTASGASSPGATAWAEAVHILSDNPTAASFTNSGTISALAYGTVATATAIRFDDRSGGGTSQTLTFTNDGGAVRAVVNNDGDLDMYGTAFHAKDASYRVHLNWRGSSADGAIFGHVEIKTGDMIDVTSGATWFDGAINPTIDDNVGTLDIFDDGKLALALNQDLGPNTSYVDAFTVRSDGTIGFEIEAESGDISRIDAITANLDGTIMVTALAGLYSGTQTYQDVIDADTRIGTFDNETTATPLLDLAVIHDGSDNVDLTVTRVAFDAVDGLTINQKSVASGIESTYSTLLADSASYADYADLVGELFTLDDSVYPDALDQLSGVEYAGTLQAALGSFRHFLNALRDRTDNPPDEGTSTSGFLNPLFAGDSGGDGQRAVWASVQGGHGDQDGDGNASGYSYNQVTALFGIDAMVNERLLIGAAGGLYAPGDIDFDNGNTVNQDTGYQIGAYAKYDTGHFHVRGFVGYGAWDASATRTISIGTLSGTNTASFDVDAWNVTGEVGHRFNRARFDLTPFAGLSYTHASVGNYAESGFAASALSGSGDDDQFDGYFGLRISGVSIQRKEITVLQELAVGYVHNFSDEASATNTLINAPLGSSFTIIGPEHGGAGFVDFSTAVVMGDRSSLSFGYLGEFGSDHQDHSGYGKFTVNF